MLENGIKDYFSNRDNIAAVYLFGSHAAGKERSGSDVDIAAHIISEEGMGLPGSAGDMFFLLHENSYLSAELAERMVKAVGLRDLLIHEYEKIDLQRLHQAAEKNVDDLMEFLSSIFRKLGIA